MKRPLDEFVARLGARLYPQLTLIDGIYSLENGPMHMGKAYRENLIVASRDMFAADSLGVPSAWASSPTDIGHLASLRREAYGPQPQAWRTWRSRGINPDEHVHRHSVPYMDLQRPLV